MPFKTTADTAFIKKLAAHLREKHGDTGVQLPTGTFLVFELPAETLETMIRTGLARARTHGFTSEADLAGFVAVMLETAPNFDDHPLLRRGLRDERVQARRAIAGIAAKRDRSELGRRERGVRSRARGA